MRHAVSLPARSTSPAPECRSLSSTTYPGEPDERSAKKRFIMASPTDVGEVAAIRPNLSIPEQHVAVEVSEAIDYVSMMKASCQRASVLLYLGKAGYDIKLVDSDDFTRAMSQVKWSIPNPSGSTVVDLFKGLVADLLHHTVKDLRSLYAIEPILSFPKDMFYGGGLESSIAKSYLINHDHEEGTHKGSSKVKQPICDIRERTMGLCSSNWKDPVHEMWGNSLSTNITFSSLPTRTLCCSSICRAVL